MYQLRRAFANLSLWTPAPQGDADDTRPLNLQEEEFKEKSDQRGEEQRSVSEIQHVLPPATHKVVTLSNPWGTHDPHPPAGWSTAAHEDPSRIRSLHLQRHAALPQSALSASVIDEDRHVKSIKRHRDGRVVLPVAEHGNEPLERVWHPDQPSRRLRRQCNTDSSYGSTYVSPSQSPLPEIGAEAELDLLRPWPPIRLTFRARQIKRAVSGRGAAAKKSMSTRRRRELDDALVQRAYEATHPTAPQGDEDGEAEQRLRSHLEASKGDLYIYIYIYILWQISYLNIISRSNYFEVKKSPGNSVDPITRGCSEGLGVFWFFFKKRPSDPI